MKLYWAPQTRSFSALWMLEETGIAYEREHVDIRSGEQDTPAYRALNPMGKVPALVDADVVVTEQGAICAWLADRYPDAGLAPKPDDPARGAYLRWLFFAGSCMEPAYMQKAFGWETVKSQAAWGDYDVVIDTLEEGMKAGSWIAGPRFSAADVMIGCGVHFGLLFGLLPERPAFRAYVDRCRGRPALARAQAIDEEGAAALPT
jgi:glutathione S-transferase